MMLMLPSEACTPGRTWKDYATCFFSLAGSFALVQWREANLRCTPPTRRAFAPFDKLFGGSTQPASTGMLTSD